MSRIAKNPIPLPSGVDVSLINQVIAVSGSKGRLEHTIHTDVEVKLSDNVLTFAPSSTVMHFPATPAFDEAP